VAGRKIHRLIISDAEGQDEGQYTVVFNDNAEDLQSSAELAIKGFGMTSATKYCVNKTYII